MLWTILGVGNGSTAPAWPTSPSGAFPASCDDSTSTARRSPAPLERLQEAVIATDAVVLVVPPQFLTQFLVLLLDLVGDDASGTTATGPSACAATASSPCVA